MMKKKCLAAAVLALSLSLGACGGNTDASSEAENGNETETVSNTVETQEHAETEAAENSSEKEVEAIPSAANVDRAFAAAGDDGWIYFRGGKNVNGFGEYRLMKMQPDGSELTVVLENCNPWYINVQDGWVYYSESKGVMYKVRTDGTELTKLKENDACENLQAAGDWIYYADRTTNMINKMRLDGSEDIELIKGYMPMNYYDGWVYYTDADYSLCRMKEDGSEAEKIAERYSDYTMDEDWIYLDSYAGKMRHDGSEVTEIGKRLGFLFSLEDDTVYYTDQAELYRRNLGGEESEIVVNSEVTSFTVVGDWIVYYDAVQKAMYRIPKNAVNGEGAEQV